MDCGMENGIVLFSTLSQHNILTFEMTDCSVDLQSKR